MMSWKYYLAMMQMWYHIKHMRDFSFGTQAYIRVVVVEEKETEIINERGKE